MPSVPSTAMYSSEAGAGSHKSGDLPGRALQPCTAARAPHIWTVPDASAFILPPPCVYLSVVSSLRAPGLLASNTYIYVRRARFHKTTAQVTSSLHWTTSIVGDDGHDDNGAVLYVRS